MAERSDRVARIQQQWARERPDVDVRPQGVIGRLHRLAGHLTEELLVVYRRYGLAEGEFDLLATLRRSGRRSRARPASSPRTRWSPPGRSPSASTGWSRPGWSPAGPASTTGGAGSCALTDAGRRLIDSAFTDHMRNERRLLDALTPEQADQLETLLATWLAQFEPAPPAER